MTTVEFQLYSHNTNLNIVISNQTRQHRTAHPLDPTTTSAPVDNIVILSKAKDPQRSNTNPKRKTARILSGPGPL
jgi:hypothetical protein